jgi:hypothetical protein
MQILPIHVGTGELGCCGSDHVATLGSRWAQPIVMWVQEWRPAEFDEPGWTNLTEHRVSVCALYGPRRGQPFEKDVLNLGICQVGTSLGGDEPGEPKIEAEGILIADWHAYWPNVEETRVEGFVRRIRTSDLVQIPAPNPMLPWPARRRVWFDMASTKNWARSDVFIDLIVDSKA